MTSQKKQEGCCNKCAGRDGFQGAVMCWKADCECHTAPVGGEGETQKGWREALHVFAQIHEMYIRGFPVGKLEALIEDILEEELAAQETAFKERVRNCLECRCGFPIHRESCPAINRDALEDQLVGGFDLSSILQGGAVAKYRGELDAVMEAMKDA